MKRAAMLAGVVLLCACAARKGVGGVIDGQAQTPRAYPERLAMWTQEAVLHDGFTTVLLVRATLMSDDLVAAMNAEQASWVIDSAPLSNPTGPTVVFSAASELGDLGFSTPAKAGAWQVGLLVDGQRCVLDALVEVKISALTRRLYPDLTPWDRQWIAQFSGCAMLGETQLQLTGAHGALEFGWRVGGDSVVAMKRGAVR